MTTHFGSNDINKWFSVFSAKVFGDGWFLSAMDSYLQLRFAAKDPAPTYVYLFTHKGSASYTALFGGDPDKYYGSHDEIIY